MRSLHLTLPTGGWRTVTGFGRDVGVYVQLVSAEKGYSVKTRRDVEYRTVSNWDEAAQDWEAERPVRIEAK